MAIAASPVAPERPDQDPQGGFTVMNLNTEALFHPNHHFHGVQAGGMEVGRHTETASARRIRLYDLP